MSSRMDKYYEDNEVVGSRTKKNEQLYQSINNSEIKNVNVYSNAEVIGDNDIDIDKIKALLEKKYYEAPKKSKTLETYEEIEEEPTVKEENTKEYDINAIIKKAKMDQGVDYEKERLKKIHDTQYDILKSLDLEKEQKESKVTSDEKNLLDLINTININEKEIQKEINPLDVLTDLKGSDNTEVIEGLGEKITKKISDSKPKEKEIEKTKVDKSFYTNSLSFTQSDFDDFNDLKEDVEINKIIVRLLLGIVAIALVIGLIFLINMIFNLGWF